MLSLACLPLTCPGGLGITQCMKATNRELDVYAGVRLGWIEIRKNGSVWRIAQRRKSRWDGTVTVQKIRPRRIDAAVGAGYRQVKFMVDGRQMSCLAHRLVWLHFHGPIPCGMVINHKNGNKADNRPTNLEVCTHSENQKHAYRIGLSDETGERNPAAKLTNVAVEMIRCRYLDPQTTQAELAKEFDVSFQAISRIVRGESRTKQGGPTADYTWRRSARPRKSNARGKFTT